MNSRGEGEFVIVGAGDCSEGARGANEVGQEKRNKSNEEELEMVYENCIRDVFEV